MYAPLIGFWEYSALQFARLYPLDQKDMSPALRPIDFGVPIPSKVEVETSAKKSQKSKLLRPLDPEKVENTCKISAIISEDAKHNLEKYAKLYGYKKLSPFLNDLLERLDLYLD